ncbi:hypothetical protein KCU65_g9001, partial [Aureobasidium melanogenum]
MFSYTSIPDLKILLRKGTVSRPVDGFFMERNYTDRELNTLKSLEPDASKAIGRQLSDTERNVLLEYQGKSIVSMSQTAASVASIGVLGGLVSTMCATRARRRWICGHYAHWMWHLSVRSLISTAIVAVPATAHIIDMDLNQPLSLRILSDSRMSEFKESIRRREMEFGGHKPRIVRRKDRNIDPPIQWFKDICRSHYIGSIKVSPPSVEECEESLPVTDYPDHPDLTWPEGSSSYRGELRDNLIVRENQILENMGWREVLELCNRTEPLSTFVYNPGPLIPRLYVE